MTAIDLVHWRLRDADPGAGEAEGAHLGQGEGWIEATAPGDTYLALIRAGRLAHPYEGRGEAAAAWVRDRAWWWTATVTAGAAAAGETLDLVFEGLDTFAAVYLDGVLLGRTDNMFRRWSFDVTARLADGGEHVLALCFSPTALAAPHYDLPVWTAFTDRVSRSRRTHMRKAQFGWGWDWGPDLPTVGIWRPARLERRTGPKIADAHAVTTALSAEEASVRVAVEVDGAGPGLRVEAILTGPDGQLAATASGEPGDLGLTVAQPRIWQTAGLGAQPLYGLTVRLFDGETLLDETTRRVGLRTLTLDTAEDPERPGTSRFRFVLNGQPLFAKGVCWIPADSFVAEADPARYRDLLTRSAQAGMNMIRVWGGGVYEPDLFYGLCDELGLLVWQDFMFACAHYPDDPAFAENVRVEVEEQVRRLRGHASLALWCGNNECQAMHDINAQIGGEPGPLGGQALYDGLMPAVVAALDPHTPYWPSSPWGGPAPNSMQGGDVHNWTVWHGLPPMPQARLIGEYDRTPEGLGFARYAEDMARFVSEFGIQAAPAMATLKRWLDPADLSPDSEGFLGRVKDVPDKAHAMMASQTGVPVTLADYAAFSQWTQAEGLKFGIEHYRRRKGADGGACWGALIWQLNDCWPSVSWSLIDYDGVAKAAHYAVARAFAPVMASFKALGGGEYELWIVNDTLAPVKGEATVALARLAGGADWSRGVAFEVAANGAAAVWRGHAPAASDDCVLTVRSPAGLFPANRLLLAPVMRLALAADARPQVEIVQAAPDRLTVTVTASAYLAAVQLESGRPDARFSDNFFDLAAGERRTLEVTAAAPLEASDLRVGCFG